MTLPSPSRIQRALIGRESERPMLSMPAAACSSPVRWLGRLELYDEELVFSGLGWTGPTEERIPIAQIEGLEKWSSATGPNLSIYSGNREGPLEVRVKEASPWLDALRERGVPPSRMFLVEYLTD